ncbi:MAG TPA: class I SAM-dependent methyltransferase [Acidimicrobiales bacterium]|nr:class I SAM-dependent methyltransferase [Acidimicrobiales bacterium]
MKEEHWFEKVAEHLGSAYLRYSFTYGTTQEVDVLMNVLALKPGDSLLDVGCGPGRHAHEFAARGIKVTGLDISKDFIELANLQSSENSVFVCGDAKDMNYKDEFDAVISLCQGAFGLAGGPTVQKSKGDPDGVILSLMTQALKPEKKLALSAFSSYFQIRYLNEEAEFNADTGVNHETTSVKNESGESLETELWTSCFTPRELRLLAASAGLEVEEIWSVNPGDYKKRVPDLDHSEYLLIAHRPKNGEKK